MTIELPAASSRALNQLVKSGAYGSPAEAVADALRLLQELLAGMNQVTTGKLSRFDDAALERIKTQGRKLLAAEKRGKRSSSR